MARRKKHIKRHYHLKYQDQFRMYMDGAKPSPATKSNAPPSKTFCGFKLTDRVPLFKIKTLETVEI